MFLLLIFAFVSGLVTVLTPCILPVLPLVLTSNVTGGPRRSLGIILGLIGSFTFFTLFLTSLVKLLNLPPDLIRNLAILVLLFWGTLLISHKLRSQFELFTSRLTNKLNTKKSQNHGFFGGLIIGVTLGILWTPCAGPILASVIAIAATATVTLETIIITAAYAAGSSLMMLLIAYGGNGITNRFKSLGIHSSKIQFFSGLIILLMSFSLITNLDRRLQIYLINHLPTWALTPLANLEATPQITQLLGQLTSDQPLSQQAIQTIDQSRLLNNYGAAPEIEGIDQWFNTEGQKYSISELNGKVVMIDFWTYSCVNCIRTLPSLRDWHQKYQEQGLVILGIHSPEFTFEKVPANVHKAIDDFEIKYPVGLDNDFRTWRNFQNRYWPAKYLIDHQGQIRYRHFGEGNYAQTERAIQLLLAEAGQSDTINDIINPDQDAQLDYNQTPETYLGLDRIDKSRLITSHSIQPNLVQKLTPVESLSLHQFTFSGEWLFTSESSQPQAGAKLRFNFLSREANLVMSSLTNSGEAATLQPSNIDAVVRESALPRGSNFCTNMLCIGSDQAPTSDGVPVIVRVSSTKLFNSPQDLREGTINVDQSRLYKLVELNQPTNYLLELEFPRKGLNLYAFTF